MMTVMRIQSSFALENFFEHVRFIHVTIVYFRLRGILKGNTEAVLVIDMPMSRLIHQLH